MKWIEVSLLACFLACSGGTAFAQSDNADSQQTTQATQQQSSNTKSDGDYYPYDSQGSSEYSYPAYYSPYGYDYVDPYGYYSPYYDWTSNDDWYDDWYQDAQEDWNNWWRDYESVYLYGDEYGYYNRYYNWQTDADWFSDWYGEANSEEGGWFDWF